MAASVCRAGSAVRRALVKARSPALLSVKCGQASVSYAQSLLGIPETQLTTLDNGLRVASEETGHATCTVGLWIDCGSRYETEKNNGAGFLLEHMAFKGTRKHPQSALEQEVESMGAHLSAYTTREHTAYFMKALSKDMPRAVELLSEVVQSPALNASDLEQQRAVVLKELEEVQGSLQDVCLDVLHATAYQGTSLGHSVLGPTQNARSLSRQDLVEYMSDSSPHTLSLFSCRSLSRQDLVEYMSSHYKAPRMVLAAAGGWDGKSRKMAASVCRAGSAVRRALVKARSPALLSVKCGQASVSYAQSLLGIPETQLTTLDNGLRVASEETGHATCTVGLWIDCGSRYETEKNNGAGFLLEHMAFKGTRKHPQSALEQEVESMGAHLSAYTTREHTAYFMKALSKDMPRAVELLSEVVQSPALNASDLEQQRAVVLKELEEVQGSLQDVCLDVLHATAYQGTSLGHSVLGPTQNARSLSRQDLVEYMSSHYKAPRMVLAAAGGVHHSELVGVAKQHFSSLSFEYEGDAVPIMSACRFTGSEIRVRDDDIPLAHVAIAVEGAGAASPDIVPLMVANAMIGSYDITFGGGKNLSSLLARMAVEHDLCQSFQAFHTSYSDTGLLGIHFVTDRHKIEDMMHCAQNQWMNLCTTVTDSDVSRAKNVLKASLLSQLDGTTPICEDIARHILTFGRRIPLAEWNARIDSVTPKVLRDICSKYLYDKCPAVAAIGPVEQLPDYNRVRSAMYWLRF
ncbi:hypothetical protein SKAU_G00107160 [Synaphobranchus kaupii]|uniref:Ubiquinol-cytochrome c reductase core protein 1 n=1 Tax=Synaphobranchus kaupii TaxID=118154 RepID=A0A9Q1FZJ2_SYNKA|nr:hypothetical protein SKAU_G00107160 [Synaphobranchus kaupii]